jgi:hypothetical protein
MNATIDYKILPQAFNKEPVKLEKIKKPEELLYAIRYAVYHNDKELLHKLQTLPPESVGLKTPPTLTTLIAEVKDLPYDELLRELQLVATLVAHSSPSELGILLQRYPFLRYWFETSWNRVRMHKDKISQLLESIAQSVRYNRDIDEQHKQLIAEFESVKSLISQINHDS